jgi:MATE family multidrug resistance protein
MISKNHWGKLFNNDPEVISLVADILPYVAFFQVCGQMNPEGPLTMQLTDGLAGTTGSILRSLGLHSTGALINLTSYYIFGLPLGLWLAFSDHVNGGKGLGLKGLWIGLSVALLYAATFSFLLVLRADWVRAVQRVRERLGLGPVEVEGVDAKPNHGDDA